MLSRLTSSVAFRSWALRRSPPPWTLAGHLRGLLRERDVGVAFDVGAHTGEYAWLLRRAVDFHGRIVSFEPNAVALAEARRRMATDSAWTGEPVAVGRKSGREILRVYTGSYFTSLRPMTSLGAAAWGQEVVESDEVDVVALDDVASRYLGAGMRAFLKVDTQGFDAEVLEGARRTIAGHVEVLQVEAPVQAAIYEGAPSFAELVEVIDGLGFDVTWIGAAATRPDGALAECDVVAQRRR